MVLLKEMHWLLFSSLKCTVTCGRGLRYRVVLCINHRGEHVGGCNPQLKLHIKEECVIPIPCYKPKGKSVVHCKFKSNGIFQLPFQYCSISLSTYYFLIKIVLWTDCNRPSHLDKEVRYMWIIHLEGKLSSCWFSTDGVAPIYLVLY